MNDTHMSPARTQRRKRSERAARASGPAYITRRLAPLNALDEESLQRIEATADRILAEVGIELRDDDEAVALFRRAGAQVEGTRLRFEPGMLRTISVPHPRLRRSKLARLLPTVAPRRG